MSIGLLQTSQNPTSSVKCTHFVDKETEANLLKNPLTGLKPRAKGLDGGLR